MCFPGCVQKGLTAWEGPCTLGAWGWVSGRGTLGKGKRHDTLAGEAFLRQDGAVEEAPRLGLVTCGEDLARLLDGAMACNFSHEAPERDGEGTEEGSDEDGLVARFLRACLKFCDVPGLPAPLREEMEEDIGPEGGAGPGGGGGGGGG